MTKNQKNKKVNLLQPDISQAISKLKFFDSFSEELKHAISQKSKLIDYEKGAKILIQGQINNDLHILVEGSLSVLVDNQLVAQLNKKGDLIGEMSVISKEPVAATICTNVKSSILTISANDLDNLNGGANDGFQHGLYRIYANDLSNKLKITNQKAKFFEELTEKLTIAQGKLTKINLDLEEKVKARTKDLIEQSKNLEISHQKLEQKNLELLNSHKKIEELYSNRETTFQKLESLYRNSLIPLQLTLLQLEEESLSSNQSILVKGASEELKEVVNLLEPITQVYYTEKAIKSKSVLLVEPNKKQQVLAKIALGGTGVDLDIVSSEEDTIQKIESKFYDIIFLPGELVELNNKILVKNPACQIVLMTSNRIDQYIEGIKNCVRIPHIISRDSEDRIFTIKNILTSVTKLASSDIFGLNKYLSWGTEILSESVTSSQQRLDLIQKVNMHFEKLGIRNSIRERSDLVLDELLMNAIYDAPVDEHGRHLHNHLSRTEVVELNRNQHSTLRYATDGLFLAISVEDPFGSLKGDVLLRYLERCYLGEVTGHLDGEKKGGGGRGLHQILENSDLVVFNIHQDHRTEVVCFLYVDPKQLGAKLPSFHLFFQGL